MIRLDCGDSFAAEWPASDLVIADPPWSYRERHASTTPADHYSVTTIANIAAMLAGLRAPRMALWMTWPILGEWMRATHDMGRSWRWRDCKTGGAWVKSRPGDAGHYGPGYHWAGCSEPVLIYSRGGGHNTRGKLRNAWIEARTQHSAKPIDWQAAMIRRWVPPGGLVVDPFAGLGSVAIATLRAGDGRRYHGCEADPDRHAEAMRRIEAETK